jgi:hypothetical protein
MSFVDIFSGYALELETATTHEEARDIDATQPSGAAAFI